MRRLVLGIAVAVTSLMPVMGVADDQQIADYIKSRLQAEQQQGNLRGFNVDMRVENGTVWFKRSCFQFNPGNDHSKNSPASWPSGRNASRGRYYSASTTCTCSRDNLSKRWLPAAAADACLSATANGSQSATTSRPRLPAATTDTCSIDFQSLPADFKSGAGSCRGSCTRQRRSAPICDFGGPQWSFDDASKLRCRRHAFGSSEPAWLRLAWLRSSPELRRCDIPTPVFGSRLALHRPVLSLPPGSTGMA